MTRATANTITDREDAEAAFRAACIEHGALWLRGVVRRYSLDPEASAIRTLTTRQLWDASRMTRGAL
jgi:hypothetical protein